MNPQDIYDPEILPVITTLAAQLGQAPLPAVHDVATRRENTVKFLKLFFDSLPAVKGVASRDYFTTTEGGHSILMRWFYKEDAPPTPDHPGPAVVHVHGGGMIAGTVEQFGPASALFASLTGVPMLAVEYRLAPEHPHPTPAEDVYAGLLWLHEHAKELGVDPARIAIMGESAGGGITAGVALMARDRGLEPKLAFQIMLFPMLDDRSVVPHPLYEHFFFWNTTDNITGWSALLGHDVSSAEAASKEVSPYAAPARATDLSGLPRAYIDVGTLDR